MQTILSRVAGAKIYSRCCLSLGIMMVLGTATLRAQSAEDVTVNAATFVLDEIMSVPAKRIPQRLLHEAQGVAIIPGMVKGGFVIGLRHGRGVILARDDAGNWRPPTFISMTGGSVGWQAGISSTDVVLVFKTKRSVDNLMRGELKIGVDAAAAAGPVGREAQASTDSRLSAEIYSYSRSRGLFAGVSLEGSGLQVDQNAQRVYYRMDAQGNPTVIPESAIKLMNRVAYYCGTTNVAAAPQPFPATPEALPLPGTMPAVPGTAPQFDASQAEIVRRQLVEAWNRLSPMLDEQWRTYAALPPGLMISPPRVDMNELNTVLQRYANVAGNPQYASLTQHPEFIATYQLLQQYVALESSQSPRLSLPPPPAAAAAGRF